MFLQVLEGEKDGILISLLPYFFILHFKNTYINIKYRKQLISKASKSLLHSIALVFLINLEVERVHCTV